MHVHIVSPSPIGTDELKKVIAGETRLELSEESRQRIRLCREYLDNKICRSGDLVYGVNTGFGALHNVAVGNRELEQLQKNLVMSHACGIGRKYPNRSCGSCCFLKYALFPTGIPECSLKQWNG